MWVLGVTGVFPSGAKYAVAFGAWAGLTEVIPYLGPVLGAMPPVIVALLHSPLTAVWVIIAYVGIQEVEGHIAAPLIMGTRFRVHPLVVMFAVLIGNQLHGIVGMFIAVPLIPLARETWVFFRARVRFEGWQNAVLDVDRRDAPAAAIDRRAGRAAAERRRPAGGGRRRRRHRAPTATARRATGATGFLRRRNRPAVAESAAEPANVVAATYADGKNGHTL